MKKIILLFAVGSIAAAIASAQEVKPSTTPRIMAKAETPAQPKIEAPAAPAPKTLTADAQFTDVYSQAVALQKTIEDIEREHAIQELRTRQQKLVLQIQAWIRDHKVEGWKYDADTKTFTEVKKPEPPGAPAKLN